MASEPVTGAEQGFGCPKCRTVLNAKAAGCTGPWHADNRPARGGEPVTGAEQDALTKRFAEESARLSLPGHDRDCASAMFNQARLSGGSSIDEIQVVHLLAIGFRAGVAAGRTQAAADPHVYFSTACLHGDHDYCACVRRPDGTPKVPGSCKFCSAPCVCSCHEGTDHD